MKRFLPRTLRRRLSATLGIAELYRRDEERDLELAKLRTDLDQLRIEVADLESILVASEGHGAAERARLRWRITPPTADLTWGQEIDGRAFVAAVDAHGGFGERVRVFEVGSGYGRLPAAAIEAGVPFSHWIGVDLSATNVSHLEARFAGDPRLSFHLGDAESFAAPPFDLLVSSLTLKHLFPTFEAALGQLGRAARPGALFAFDLFEGDRRYFEPDGVTYLRHYRRQEVIEILRRVGLHLEGFLPVVHAPGFERLLVLARRPGP